MVGNFVDIKLGVLFIYNAKVKKTTRIYRML